MLRWATRSIAALVLAGVLGVLQYRSAMQARIADEQARLATQEVHAARALADARAIESELEQGRAALLHGEPEALPHLARAYRSEPSATTAFMLARAMEPRLAERARLASTFGRMWWAAFVGLQVAVLEGPQGVVRTAGFGPNQQVVDASWDGTARVWDAASPFRRFSSDPIGRECGRVMGAVPEGRFIAIGCGMRPTAVWDTAQDRLLTELPAATPSVTGGYASAFPAISADGDRAAIARGNTVALYEIPGGRLLRTIEHKAAISAVAFASDGRDLATGAIDGSTTVTRDDGSSEVLQAGAGVDTVELLPDGRVVVSDAARRLRVYGANGAILADLETPSRIRSLRRAGDRIVALPSYTGPIVPPVLVDLERYRMVALLDSHTGQVFSARWTRDQRIITAGADGAARLWDGATGLPLQTYAGGTRFLADAMLTPDGLVIGGDADGLVRIWDGATGAKLWILQAHKSAVIGVHIAGDGSGDIVTLGSTGEISRWRLRRPEQVIDACVHEPLCAVLPR
jgi:WD40 repeat protein